MKNILPRDRDVWLLVTEEAQIESNGKMSLRGFLGGERIQVPTDTRFPTAISLTLVYLLRHGVGKFRATFQAQDPVGNLTKVQYLSTVEKLSPVENHGLSVVLPLMMLPMFGRYRLILTLDDKRYERALSIAPETFQTAGNDPLEVNARTAVQ